MRYFHIYLYFRNKGLEQSDTEYICNIVTCVELNTFKYIKVGLCCFWREKISYNKTQPLMSANARSVLINTAMSSCPFWLKSLTSWLQRRHILSKLVFYYPIIATYNILTIRFFLHRDVFICYILQTMATCF